MRHALRLAAVIAAAALLTPLVSCSSDRPVTTVGEVTSHMTLEELQLWVADQFDQVLLASGVERGWMDMFEEDFEWRLERSEDQLSMINVWLPHGCGDVAGKLNEWLLNHSADDPLLAAKRVREHWENEGWVVSDVLSYPSEEEVRFRADREDGALLGLSAHPDGLALQVVTPCSAHVTVSQWKLYRDSTLEDEGAAGGA